MQIRTGVEVSSDVEVVRKDEGVKADDVPDRGEALVVLERVGEGARVAAVEHVGHGARAALQEHAQPVPVVHRDTPRVRQVADVRLKKKTATR